MSQYWKEEERKKHHEIEHVKETNILRSRHKEGQIASCHTGNTIKTTPKKIRDLCGQATWEIR